MRDDSHFHKAYNDIQDVLYETKPNGETPCVWLHKLASYFEKALFFIARKKGLIK